MAVRARHRPCVLGDSLSARRPSTTPTSADPARYDAAYFDKWYRQPRTRVKSRAELARQAAFVLHSAEWVLGRRVRTVLDVGCGEGNWQPVLRRLRPGIAYTGVDPSAYAVERYGARRGLLLGGIEDVARPPLASQLRVRYDLVVCCGMLNYLSAEQFRAGIRALAPRVGGMAYLEVFAEGDAFEGDTDWPAPQPAGWYRRVMRSAGLVSAGMQCWVPAATANLSAMERG